MEKLGSNIIESFTQRHPVLNAKINGFTQIPNRFLLRDDITIYEKMVWVILKKYKMRNAKCWPAEDTIAANVPCGITSVKKALNGLECKGLLIKSRDKQHRSNTYEIRI